MMPSRTSGWSSATRTRIIMRSAPARRALALAFAPASFVDVTAVAALASAGLATMSFFIPLPQLVGRSRPVRRDETHSPMYRLARPRT